MLSEPAPDGRCDNDRCRRGCQPCSTKGNLVHQERIYLCGEVRTMLLSRADRNDHNSVAIRESINLASLQLAPFDIHLDLLLPPSRSSKRSRNVRVRGSEGQSKIRSGDERSTITPLSMNITS